MTLRGSKVSTSLPLAEADFECSVRERLKYMVFESRTVRCAERGKGKERGDVRLLCT